MKKVLSYYKSTRQTSHYVFIKRYFSAPILDMSNIFEEDLFDQSSLLMDVLGLVKNEVFLHFGLSPSVRPYEILYLP